MWNQARATSSGLLTTKRSFCQSYVSYVSLEVMKTWKLSNKISENLQIIDASELRTALADIDEATSVGIHAKELEYYLGEILEMSKQNLEDIEDIIKSLKAMFSTNK